MRAMSAAARSGRASATVPAWPMMVMSGSRSSMKARACRNARWSSTSTTRIVTPIDSCSATVISPDPPETCPSAAAPMAGLRRTPVSSKCLARVSLWYGPNRPIYGPDRVLCGNSPTGLRSLGGTASVVSPEPRREPRRATTAQHVPNTAPDPWLGRLRRSKLRRPDLPASVLPRPRLMARIDDGHCPLTLIVAPAGFGKTTIAAAWASQEPFAAWLTADFADASLPRFWAHLREAIGDVTP